MGMACRDIMMFQRLRYWNYHPEDYRIMNNPKRQDRVYVNVLFEIVRDAYGIVREYVVENYHVSSRLEDITAFTQQLGKEYYYYAAEVPSSTYALEWLSQYRCNCPCTPKWALGIA